MAFPSIARASRLAPRLAPLTHTTPAAPFRLQPSRSLRRYTTEQDNPMTPVESEIASSLSTHDTLKPAHSVLVRDVSGGCGSMYAIDIASEKFRGKGLLAQQRLVTKALGERVKEWHGVQIRTSVPPSE